MSPPASLEPFSELFWTHVDSPVSAGREAGWRIVPDAAPHLIVTRLRTLAGETSPSGTRTSLVGARSRYVDGHITRRAWTVGVRFRPGVLPLLTGLPAPDLADRSVAVAYALRGAGTRLSDDLEAAATPDQALDLILAFLLRVLRGVPTPDRRVVALEQMVRERDRRGPESTRRWAERRRKHGECRSSTATGFQRAARSTWLTMRSRPLTASSLVSALAPRQSCVTTTTMSLPGTT